MLLSINTWAVCISTIDNRILALGIAIKKSTTNDYDRCMDANCTVEITKLPTATMYSLFFYSLSSLFTLFALSQFYVVFARCWIIEHGAYLISRQDTDIENLHDISNIRNKHSILYRRYFDRQMKILCACKYAKYIIDDWNMVNGREFHAIA